MDLCGDFIDDSPLKGHEYPAGGVSALQEGAVANPSETTTATMPPEPTDTSPQTQINSVLSMMWPNVQPLEAADVVMGDDAWMDFLKGGTIEEGDDAWFNGS
jgi:transcriptional regulatory protein GAL4